MLNHSAMGAIELLDVETIGLLVALAAPCASEIREVHLGAPSSAGIGYRFYHVLSCSIVHSFPQKPQISIYELRWIT